MASGDEDVSFEAVLENGDIFKKIIDGIKDLVTEGNVDVTDEGMSLQGMDSSHVSLVSMSLRPSGFEDFSCDSPLVLGINFNNLNKILKCSNSKDRLTISCNQRDRATFMFEPPNEERTSSFDMKLIDIDGESLDVPETDYQTVITMVSTDFKKIMSDLQQLGDTVTISATKEGVKFSTKGDIGDAEVILRNSSTGSRPVQIELEENVDLSFALRYLTMFTKCTNLSQNVVVSLSSGIPLCVEYALEDMGFIKFYLAPKLEDDDD